MTLICLHTQAKKSYKWDVPICPRCNATIHTGAEEQCPACGYGMARADSIFGMNDVEFTRVVDEAGALTHQERMELLRYLAGLERRISPVALCVYITDHGQPQEFRPHAHWVLNHARIHHPSFGKREQMRAIEDAELRERRPGEARPVEETPSWISSTWQNFCDWLRDICLPTPPPTRQDWMLILVLDVQLEIACFTWGYMLDPYVNPDKITSTIISARLQFRERAFMNALKLVMKKAAGQLALATRKVNKTLRQNTRRKLKSLALFATLGTALCAPHAQAQDAPAPAAEAPAETPAETPAPQPAPEPAPPVVPGVPAGYNVEPRWSSTDYAELMSGNLPNGLNLLMPGGKQRSTSGTTTPTSTSSPGGRTRTETENEESDTTVPGRYCRLYLSPHGTALRDPQQLLTDVEREDISHLLRELNANSKFHIYVSIFKAGQEIPCEVSAANLVRNIAEPGQYTVLLQYCLGEPPVIDIGYREITPTDDQIREWQEALRRCISISGSGVEGLMASIHCLHGIITPLSANFTPLDTDSAHRVTRVILPAEEEIKIREITWKDEVKAWVLAGGATPYVIALVASEAMCWLIYFLFMWNRSCGRLYESEPDYRLASRYGAGVSRFVRYLEGKEAGKEKKPL